MPINDPVNSVYMNNMYVTGTGAQAASGAAAGVSNTASGVANTNVFSQMLSSMMGMSALGVGDFSSPDGGSASSGMDSLMGLGGSSSMGGLGGLGGSSETGMIMMMLLLLLASQNSNGQNNNLMNLLTGNANTSTVATAAACPHTAGYAPAPGGVAQGIPSNAWEVSNPPLTNDPGSRSAAAYRAVIDQFDVESNERYRVNKQGNGDTYCNIFAWDVTRAMGAEVPHFIDNTTGAPASSGGDYFTELTANQVNDWLNTNGASYGWHKATAEEAQYYANMGMPAITSWKNPSGHGHMQVVSPSVTGQYDASRGVAIAQAGRQLKNYDYIDSVYGSATLPKVEYFVHV